MEHEEGLQEWQSALEVDERRKILQGAVGRYERAFEAARAHLDPNTATAARKLVQAREADDIERLLAHPVIEGLSLKDFKRLSRVLDPGTCCNWRTFVLTWEQAVFLRDKATIEDVASHMMADGVMEFDEVFDRWSSIQDLRGMANYLNSFVRLGEEFGVQHLVRVYTSDDEEARLVEASKAGHFGFDVDL